MCTLHLLDIVLDKYQISYWVNSNSQCFCLLTDTSDFLYYRSSEVIVTTAPSFPVAKTNPTVSVFSGFPEIRSLYSAIPSEFV